MAKRDRSRARKRARAAEQAEDKQVAERPEAVRSAVVCLYAAAAITLAFLVMAGDRQWYEFQASGLGMAMAALVCGIVSCVADALAGFALSRSEARARWLAYVSPGFSLAVAALSFTQVIVASPGFFIARNISILMELAALWLLRRPAARDWFDALG